MANSIKISDFPNAPGVYVFRNLFGKVIYVGKALNLKKRVSQYFRKSSAKIADPKFRSLVKSIAKYDFFRTYNENEALLLEMRLIKEYAPQYNVVMRDDKRFLLVKIDMCEKFPSLKLVRLKKNDGSKYWGPFPHGGALRDTVEFLSSQFGLKTCKASEPGITDYRHCVAGGTGTCCAPCIGRTSEENYRAKLESLIAILEGGSKEVCAKIEEKMRYEAESAKYEKAAKLRDIAENIRSLFRRDRKFVKAYIPNQGGADSVEMLRKVLALEDSPRRMEAFDISNISGALAVASMVSFFDGKPDRKNYRRFRIQGGDRPNDFAMMSEVVERRYSRLLSEKKTLPDLIIIDGGKGQISAAIEALKKCNVKNIPVLGLAKKTEKIFLPDSREPLLLDRHSPALKLLQAIRDEAHRFALAYHRKLRERRIEDSLLDEIPGIGKKRKIILLKEFGSVENIRKFSANDIAKRIPGMGAKFAKKIAEFLSK
jgi:excinuclease ABC subunit C